MDEAVGYLLELRVRLRGNPEAVAVVDLCLGLIAQARTADAATQARIERQVDELRAELEQRLGPPKALVRH